MAAWDGIVWVPEFFGSGTLHALYWGMCQWKYKFIYELTTDQEIPAPVPKV